jgi:excisionase family DNA binding protein
LVEIVSCTAGTHRRVFRTGLSDSSIRRAIRHRRLAVHRIGSVLRVSEADLMAFLRGCRRAAK